MKIITQLEAVTPNVDFCTGGIVNVEMTTETYGERGGVHLVITIEGIPFIFDFDEFVRAITVLDSNREYAENDESAPLAETYGFISDYRLNT